MRSLRPEQILLLLVFILVPLLNLLVRWLQRRAAREPRHPVPAESRPAEPVGRTERAPAPMPPRGRIIEPVRPRERPRETTPAPRSRPPIRGMTPLGGRAAVRRAVVAMAILGPCRALEERPPRG